MSVADPFAELGLAPDAEPEVVQAAFKVMAQKYHPDRNPSGEDRMKRLTEAFAIVSDPRERAQWERRRVASGRSESTRGAGYPPPPSPQPRPAGPSCAHHLGSTAAASCTSCGRPMCAVCVDLRRRLGGGGVCTGCRTGQLQWRVAMFIGLLLAGAGLWRFTVHPSLVASLLLAYPAAAIPTGLRLWRRVRSSRLGAVLAGQPASVGGRLATSVFRGVGIAVLGMVTAPVDVSLSALLLAFEMRAGGGAEGWWQRCAVRRWGELRSHLARLRRMARRAG